MTGGWATETIVDLGDRFDVTPLDRWPRPPRIRLRQVVLVATVAAVLLLIAASQAAPRSALRVMARVPVGLDATIMINGANLYVYDTSAGHNAISAYDLPTGTREWTSAMPEIAALSTLRYVDGLVVVSMIDTDTVGEHTVALEPRTGATAWTSDLGLATPVTGGVMVEAMSRPPGFNYPGTPSTGTVSVLDSATGRARWSHPIPASCVAAVGSSDATPRPTSLVELCSNSSTLTTIRLADGHVAAARRIDLGDPARNFQLAQSDRLDVPRLVVAAGVVLVAHADRPAPSIDAYAIDDLHPLWTGLLTDNGQDAEPCGSAICLYERGASTGVEVDPSSGRIAGAAPSRAGAPADGSFVLLGLAKAAAGSSVTKITSAAPGIGVPIATTGPAVEPDARNWLAIWHADSERTEGMGGSGFGSPIELLHGVTAPACAQTAALLMCAMPDAHLTVWRVPN